MTTSLNNGRYLNDYDLRPS